MFQYVLNSVQYLNVANLTENQERHSFKQFLHQKGSTRLESRDVWKSVENVKKPDYSDFDLFCQDTTCHSKHAVDMDIGKFSNFASINNIV